MPIYTPGTATYNNPVRYIRDSINGNNKNTSSHWVEIQALDSSGNNIAKGKTVTLIYGTNTENSISRLTDGDTTTANFFGSGTTSPAPTVQVDLGAVYDIANIKIWHYYGDSRIYNNPVTQVSADGNTWVTISDGTTYTETSAGKTWSCDSVASQQVLVNYEIGKLYDYDGTTSYQIGKVYDWDGTASSLIYSAEQYIVGAEGNNTVQKSYGNGCGNWYGDPVKCMAVWSFDATGWDTIHVDISNNYTYYTNPDNSSYHVNATTKFGYSTSAKTVGTDYSQSTFTKYIWSKVSGIRTTYTIDISGASGTIYFWIGHAQGGGGINSASQLYNLWLT